MVWSSPAGWSEGEECEGQFDPQTNRCREERRGGVRMEGRQLEVEFGERSLPARLRVLAVEPLAVTLHLGQVLVKDFARSQR